VRFGIRSVFAFLFSVVAIMSAAADGGAIEKRSTEQLMNDHVRILICTSWGYGANFQAVRNELEARYPHLVGRIEGGHYPVDEWKQQLSSMLGYIQSAVLLLVIFGDKIFEALGAPMPELIKGLNENKMAGFVGVMLVGSFSSTLMKTNAFEVYYNDVEIFSKIKLNRMPSMDELMHLFREAGLRKIN